MHIENPQGFLVLDMSTEHVTESDGKLLCPNNVPQQPIIHAYEEGAFVYCAGKEPEYYPAFSSEFNAIIEYARQRGYRYVCFDCDGPVYEDVPKFYW